jgi:putative ABC transport system substrate-binding protein
VAVVAAIDGLGHGPDAIAKRRVSGRARMPRCIQCWHLVPLQASLRMVLPSISPVFWNPNNVTNKLELEKARTTAEALGLTSLPIEILVLDDIESAFVAMTRQRADGALILSSPLTSSNRPRIVDLALRARMPTVGAIREYADAGLLMSYGPSYVDGCRRAATYVDRILKGEQPANLPVELPTTFELIINLKTTRALDLKVRPNLLARADELIE